jgi:hypothetical protein
MTANNIIGTDSTPKIADGKVTWFGATGVIDASEIPLPVDHWPLNLLVENEGIWFLFVRDCRILMQDQTLGGYRYHHSETLTDLDVLND